MTLHLPEDWVWDFWFAQDGADYHIFYLQAPRSLGDPELRHWNVRIGHAVSQDIIDWQILPDALHPAPETSAVMPTSRIGCTIVMTPYVHF